MHIQSNHHRVISIFGSRDHRRGACKIRMW